MTDRILKPIYGRWKRVSPWHDFLHAQKTVCIIYTERRLLYCTALKYMTLCPFSYELTIIVCYTKSIPNYYRYHKKHDYVKYMYTTI